MSRRNSKRGPRKPPRQTRPAPSAGAGPLLLHGWHPVLAALTNPHRRWRRLLATPEAAEKLAAALAEAGREWPADRVERVEKHRIEERLGAQAVHQGLLLETEPLPELDWRDLVTPEVPAQVLVALDQVTDPHNVGAILRSAAAFGANGVIVTDRHAPPETGVLAKSASGALDRVKLARVTNLARTLEDLKDAGFWCVGLDAAGPQTLAEALPGGDRSVVLVLGAEGEGLRRLTRETCDALARLPMAREAVDSLNVSNAAAVALYEVRRGAG
jgi:23S rRNA (guanosine2251-2'-O)-methyltransferase